MNWCGASAPCICAQCWLEQKGKRKGNMAVDRNDKGEKTVCSHLGTGERAPANIKEMFIHVAPLSIVLRNIYSFSLSFSPSAHTGCEPAEGQKRAYSARLKVHPSLLIWAHIHLTVQEGQLELYSKVHSRLAGNALNGASSHCFTSSTFSASSP